MFEEEFAICATRLRRAEIRCQPFGASVFRIRSNTIPPAWGIQDARINVSGVAPPAPTSPPGSGVGSSSSSSSRHLSPHSANGLSLRPHLFGHPNVLDNLLTTSTNCHPTLVVGRLRNAQPVLLISRYSRSTFAIGPPDGRVTLGRVW